MQARAGAMDELLASGVLEDATGSTKDDITRELEALSSGSDVENELARMKAQIGSGPGQQQALPGGQGQSQQPPTQQPQQPPFQAYPTEEQPNSGGMR